MGIQNQEIRFSVPLAEAARAVGLTPKTLHNWSSAGKLPFPTFRVGGRRMVRISDLEAYIASLLPPASSTSTTEQQPATGTASRTDQPRRRPGRPRKALAGARQ